MFFEGKAGLSVQCGQGCAAQSYSSTARERLNPPGGVDGLFTGRSYHFHHVGIAPGTNGHEAFCI